MRIKKSKKHSKKTRRLVRKCKKQKNYWSKASYNTSPKTLDNSDSLKEELQARYDTLANSEKSLDLYYRLRDLEHQYRHCSGMAYETDPVVVFNSCTYNAIVERT